VERNRISSLHSHGKALEKKCCLPGVFRDSGDTPANVLCGYQSTKLQQFVAFVSVFVDNVGNFICELIW